MGMSPLASLTLGCQEPLTREPEMVHTIWVDVMEVMVQSWSPKVTSTSVVVVRLVPVMVRVGLE